MMKKPFPVFVFLVLMIGCAGLNASKDRVVIPKDNGNIILAYKGFERFLDSGRTWSDYEKHVLNAFPLMTAMHGHYMYYDLIDSAGFWQEVTDYQPDDFNPFFSRINEKRVSDLYDAVIGQMDRVLPPLDSVDVCFFLPYFRDCFVMDVSGRKTVFISIKFDPEAMDLILIHEYAHCLHHQRRPPEPSSLKKSVVSEGIASCFPVLLSGRYTIYDGLWMMPRENVDWCMDNEQKIITQIVPDLNKAGIRIDKQYIAGGEGFAEPPPGFPEKTGYYIGYRIIEKCMERGISLSELCRMDSETMIQKSGVLGERVSS